MAQAVPLRNEPARVTAEQAHELTICLRRCVLAVDAYRADRAREGGLTLTEMTALGHIAMKEVTMPKDLGERLRLTTASVTALVDRLERRQLVRRRPNPFDRRSVILAPTDGGRALYEHFRVSFIEDVELACRDLNPDQVTAAMLVLSRVTEGYAARDARPPITPRPPFG